MDGYGLGVAAQLAGRTRVEAALFRRLHQAMNFSRTESKEAAKLQHQDSEISGQALYHFLKRDLHAWTA